MFRFEGESFPKTRCKSNVLDPAEWSNEQEWSEYGRKWWFRALPKTLEVGRGFDVLMTKADDRQFESILDRGNETQHPPYS